MLVPLASDFLHGAQRGVNFGYGDQGMRSAADLDSVAALGAGHVRTWLRPKVDGDEASIPQHDIDAMLATINGLHERGVSSVVSICVGAAGKPGGRLWASPALRASFVRLVASVARLLRRHPAVLGIDFLNEPQPEHGFGGQAIWRALMLAVCRAVRRFDARRVLIVQPTPHGRIDALAGVEPLPFGGIVYSVHCWLPWELTHGGVVDGFPLSAYSDEIKHALADHCAPLLAWSRMYKLPVYIGEVGCNTAAPGAAQYLADALQIFRPDGYSWAYHEWRGWPDWNAEANPELLARLRLELATA